MGKVIEELSKLALTVYGSRPQKQKSISDYYHNIDSVIQDAIELSQFDTTILEKHKEIEKCLLSDNVLKKVMTTEEQKSPMVLTSWGGQRVRTKDFIIGLLNASLFEMFIFDYTETETTFLRIVIENYERLYAAILNSNVEVCELYGLGRIELDKQTEITTPWGNVKRAPQNKEDGRMRDFGSINTKCILYRRRTIPIVFDRAPNPKHKFEGINHREVNQLVPISFALASLDYRNPAMPIITWNTAILPFVPYHGYSQPFLPKYFGKEIDITKQKEQIEEWARIIQKENTKEIDIAIDRIYKAVAYRNDSTDSLIDALIVWENLLGASTEVTFRVSAGLSKLIESEPSKRVELKKKLSKIYNLRSKIVHGADFNIKDVKEASIDAIDIALKAIAISLRKGKEWLSMNSTSRCDDLLLK